MKRKLPGATMTVFKFLAKLKGLRGTRFDLFGRTEERHTERALIDEYHDLVRELLIEVHHDNYDKVVEIVSLAERIKGFGHIKMSNIERYREQLARLRKKLKEPDLAVVVNG